MQFDLAGKTAMADRMIVASGTSTRQVTAMADHVVSKLKALGLFARSEGKKQGDWVLVDAGDVVVHLFRPEVRAFYDIERLWAGQTPMALNLPAPKPVIIVSTAPVATSMAEKSVVKKVAKKTAKKNASPQSSEAKVQGCKTQSHKAKSEKTKTQSGHASSKKTSSAQGGKTYATKTQSGTKEKGAHAEAQSASDKEEVAGSKEKNCKAQTQINGPDAHHYPRCRQGQARTGARFAGAVCGPPALDCGGERDFAQ